MIFGRKKRDQVQEKPQVDEDVELEAEESADAAENSAREEEPVQADASSKSAAMDSAYDRAAHGPFDVDELDSHDGYVDLGALLIEAVPNLQLRLEIEESSQRVIAVTLDLDGSSLQLQAFAAPKSEGLWGEIREQISLSVTSQGGNSEELDGAFGTEILAKLPAQAADGSGGYRVARFIGVDGPRWFLRGVIGGQAAIDRDAAEDLENLFRSVAVVRGDVPMPPRDLLPLRLPKDAAEAPAEQAPEFEPLERGPEITEIR